jgi:starch phosphorylase
MAEEETATGPGCAFLSEGASDIDPVIELALDMRWSWSHAADELWERIEPTLWEVTHNAWTVLQSASRDSVRRALAEPGVRALIDGILEARRAAAETPAWFQQSHPKAKLKCVAYFCMEYMLSEALPIYSGGLGNVAGDQLKAASDLGVPIVAVGLLYQQGYFRQAIDRNGAQRALFPYNDPGQLPIRPLREPDGELLRIQIPLSGYAVRVRTWEVRVGNARLYLLDSNDPANLPSHRGITSELYGEGQELRLTQEILLGIAGWRLLEALKLEPDVCHMNEGHTAFVVLARTLSLMEKTGQPFRTALAATRAGNIFTTHTPVAAGFDRFSPSLIDQYLGAYARERLGISLDDLLALGRVDPGDTSQPFNMACLAVRGSGYVNGVSRLHGQVSREIFRPLFPRWPTHEIPVGHVTNGVHMPTWESDDSDRVWTEACERNRWQGTLETMEDDLRDVPDSKLWELRCAARKSLIEYVRERTRRHMAALGASSWDLEAVKGLFSADSLTIGFARRFATYKRPTLLLHDPERLLRILASADRPVQLIVAGKAHPADAPGQAMIEEWTDFIARRAGGHAVFLEDHDMLMTQRLVQGVDVWINTPRRPWEACGTSGMKVLVNGGINLSELDGWWAEGYSPSVGWALGDGKEHDADLSWDAAEAEALYALLEREVIPDFYKRDKDGMPAAWVARMRESMARLTPRFSSNRAVREYTENYYIPAAEAYRERVAEKCSLAARIVSWQKEMERKWPALRFGAGKVETIRESHRFTVPVYLGDLDPDFISVQLYADGKEGGDPFLIDMARGEPQAGVDGFIYTAEAPANRPSTDYTPRAVPRFPGSFVPLEAARILWQR